MRQPGRVLRKRIIGLGFFFLLLIASTGRIQAAGDLFTQIQTLQNQTHIQISGLEKIQNGEQVLTGGNVDQQIKQLFAGYNHIVSRNKKGEIDRIVILGKKEKPKDNRILVPIDRRGNNSTMSVSLSGDGRNWLTLDMVIDTGADLVILPESMIGQLGLDENMLTPNRMQTANGIAEARIGKLKEVKIAGETVEDVETAFIADRLLGDNRLLGMSVLGRYQLSIDDSARIVTLIRK